MPVLIDIVSTVIEQKVKTVQIRGNELPISDIEEKAQRFDVNCTIENDDQIDIEMHCSRQLEEIGDKRSNFLNKYTYYITDLHSSQKSRGLEYEKLVRTYQATFTMHPVFPSLPNFVNRFSLRTQDGMLFSDQINLVLIELSKLDYALKKSPEELTPFEKWSLFLRFADMPVYRNYINAIIKEKEEIAMAATILREISKDEHERARLRSRKMYEADMCSNILTAERRGEMRSDLKWEKVVVEKDAIIADYAAENARLRAELENRK